MTSSIWSRLTCPPHRSTPQRPFSTDRIVISHDTDFGTLLACQELSKPSFILIRSSDLIDADDQARLIVANLDAISEDLKAGAIAVFACHQVIPARSCCPDVRWHPVKDP
jgi:hypothetical protein